MFQFEGQSLPITSPRTFEIEAEFTLFVKRSAALDVEAQKAFMSPAWYAAQMELWQRNCAAHAFDWGSPAWYGAFTSEAGVKELAWLQMAHAQAQLAKERKPFVAVDRELIDRIAKVPEKLKELTDIIWEVQEKNAPKAGTKEAAAP